jgi:hypothetical protein
MKKTNPPTAVQLVLDVVVSLVGKNIISMHAPKDDVHEIHQLFTTQLHKVFSNSIITVSWCCVVVVIS